VELTWAAERIESALFRERINDVACEVVRITRAPRVRACRSSRYLLMQPW
jgi:hypothetical protein